MAATRQAIRLAVLISGGGTTLLNLLDKIDAGRLSARIELVICSNPAAERKVRDKLGDRLPPTQVIHRKTFNDVTSFSQTVFNAIRSSGAELVALAGFLCLLEIPDDYARRVLNIHPALLPAFGGQGMYGHNVHEAVIAHGCKVSGCTVHFADQTYDTGPILVQRCCPVRDDDTPDTLAARVFEQECQAYPEAIQLIAEQRVEIVGRVARIR
ncbi:MAG: phosphoribosylglycinamide formyltransferase [Phycisphaeraceae bacterium]|nr:phosphoribosylglycinamide formyltransferase [Phycisphaeraceae bacterium]